jgi:VanZ family protein
MAKPRLLLPVAALLFFTFLFCLPGSAFPKDDWITRLPFDKVVHIGIFSILLFLWCRAFIADNKLTYIILIVSALVYGFLIELIQDRFVENRSWDLWDVAADFIGTIAGSYAWYRYKKNKPL